ncbi:MAG TPA: hypothetical protein VE954_32580 [Oligoflexus sp.]|uniref:hypothetical protein n=1 Tax=Oligoflexus sp. TaxID=1971216 RepID=UPI002D69D87A|nr:hypothetical protein [Oligoflexus sp.]HYX37865.1 hypothetical protein [Oligoflexus sp.]
MMPPQLAEKVDIGQGLLQMTSASLGGAQISLRCGKSPWGQMGVKLQGEVNDTYSS